jgi:protein-tyrosine phosphatase
MAEMVMKEIVRKAGREKDFHIESRAATTEEIGHDIYPPAKRTLKAHNIPFTKHRATLITKEDYKKADYIIAMDQENLYDLDWLCGHDPDKKVSLLLAWAGEKRDVADPWYTGNFERTFEDVMLGCKSLLEKL